MPYTLTVNFTLATPDPGSYRVKFWPTSNPSNITTRLVSNSPFQEFNLPETSYAGTIEASCGSGNYSTPVSFSSSVAVDDVYLSVTEIIINGNKRDVRWVISDSAGATSESSSGTRTLPFDLKMAYTVVGTNIFNQTGQTSGLVSGLQLMSGNKSVVQGNQSDEITAIHTISLSIKETNSGVWGSYIPLTNSAGTNIGSPVTYVNTSSGQTFNIILMTNSFAVNIYT